MKEKEEAFLYVSFYEALMNDFKSFDSSDAKVIT